MPLTKKPFANTASAVLSRYLFREFLNNKKTPAISGKINIILIYTEY